MLVSACIRRGEAQITLEKFQIRPDRVQIAQKINSDSQKLKIQIAQNIKL